MAHASYYGGVTIRLAGPPGRPLRPMRFVEANQPAGGAASKPPAAAAAAAAPPPSAQSLSTSLQVLVAFLLAGFGNVGAGLILDHVKEWPVFLNVNELFILVPSLLGLKGNLEMTMASRLSTQANLGHMDNAHELFKMAKGNLALVQCQATVVSFVVALFASGVKALAQAGQPAGLLELQLAGAANGSSAAGSAPDVAVMLASAGSLGPGAASLAPAAAAAAAAAEPGAWDNALLLCASSLLTANIACFVLGSMMILVIVGSHRCHIDPDNIAAPVAASFGDMTTAALLAVVAHSMYSHGEASPARAWPYLELVVTLLFLAMLPVWYCVARSNPYTAHVITRGWTPIVAAVFISSCGGFILEHGKERFRRLPLFQPVVNGVGGNLVAVQASRLSTALHREGKPGQLQADFKPYTGPLALFLRPTRGDPNLATARLLLLMAVPAHLLYFFVIHFTEPAAAELADQAPLSLLFLALYMLLAVLQVAVLLYLAQNLVSLLWRFKLDPDNYSTPLLTATGDLLGCAFLLLAFVIAYQLNDPYTSTIVRHHRL